jgi:hypothetical protein
MVGKFKIILIKKIAVSNIAGGEPSSENYIQWYDWLAKKNCRGK